MPGVIQVLLIGFGVLLHADRGWSHVEFHLQNAVEDKEQLYAAIVLLLHAPCHQCCQLILCLQPCTFIAGSNNVMLTVTARMADTVKESQNLCTVPQSGVGLCADPVLLRKVPRKEELCCLGSTVASSMQQGIMAPPRSPRSEAPGNLCRACAAMSSSQVRVEAFRP